MAALSELIGKTIKEIQKQSDQLIFTIDDDSQYKMYHNQGCCENVSIDDIVGDLDDLIGNPILLAEETSNSELSAEQLAKREKGIEELGDDYYDDTDESFTWTFYKLATIKGYVTIRWYGTSNGYYSESVDFVLVGSDEDW
jgi:hypothetical protein